MTNSWSEDFAKWAEDHRQYGSNRPYARLRWAVNNVMQQAYMADDGKDMDYCSFCGTNKGTEHGLRCIYRILKNALEETAADFDSIKRGDAIPAPPVIDVRADSEFRYIVPIEILKSLVENPRLTYIEIESGETIKYNASLTEGITATLETKQTDAVPSPGFYLPLAVINKLREILDDEKQAYISVMQWQYANYHGYPFAPKGERVLLYAEDGMLLTGTNNAIDRGFAIRIIPAPPGAGKPTIILYIVNGGGDFS